MKRILVTYTGCAVCLFCASVYADGVPISPGKWEMISTVNAPMIGEPQVTTMNQCMNEDMLTPENLSDKGMDQGCTIQTTQISGNTMRWTMTCPTEGSEMVGDWTATSNGDTISGEGTVSASYGGQEFKMTMSWEGKRIGPCDS